MTQNPQFIEDLLERREDYKKRLAVLRAEQNKLAGEVRLLLSRLTLVEDLLKLESPQHMPNGDSQTELTNQGYESLSVKDAVEKVLRERGTPMHAREVMETLQSHGVRLSQKDPLATVVTILLRGQRAGVYERTGRNEYRFLAAKPNNQAISEGFFA